MKYSPTKPTNIDADRFYAQKDNKQKIEYLLRYAVLAPSTHNTQPWKIKIEDSTCSIFADMSRQLPSADSKRRDLYISLGAFVKTLEIAAQAFGVYQKTRWVGQNNLAASVYFENLDKPTTKLNPSSLNAVQTRCNYRGPFAKVAITPNLKQLLETTDSKDIRVDLITNQQKIKSLGQLTSDALKFAYSNPDFRREISSWIRPNTSKKKTGIPGYSLRMGTLASYVIPRLIKRVNIGKKLAGLNYKSFITASGVVIISSPIDNPAAWLRVGYLAQGAFVNLEQERISASIFVAAIEMGEFNKTVASVSDTPSGFQPQLLFCIGKPILPKVYSPRESVQSKLIS